MKFKKLFGILICVGLICANFFIFYFLHTENNRQFLKVVFLDVGQGDSIFIEAPNGRRLLIDSGPSAAVVRQISKQLSFYDRKIDIIYKLLMINRVFE